MDHGLSSQQVRAGLTQMGKLQVCREEPPLSSGNCSSFPLLPSFLCVQIFWEHALIPSMCRDVRSGLFPISSS